MIRNIDAIHITKRKIAEEICKIVDSSNIVKRLIIFGSAVTDRCSAESGIDICIDTDCSDNDMKLLIYTVKLVKPVIVTAIYLRAIYLEAS